MKLQTLFSVKTACLLAAGVLFFGCSDDEEPVDCTTPAASMRLLFNPVANGGEFVQGQVFTLPDGTDMRIVDFRFFLSDITLERADGTELLADDIALFDFDPDPPGNPDWPDWTNAWEMEVPAGDYTGVRFGIGVKPALNATNPVDFENTHPLSSSHSSLHWGWIGYRFVVLDGFYDPGTGSLDKLFSLHSGVDTSYYEIPMISKSFSVTDGETTDVPLTLDMEEFFFGANDTILVQVDSSAHGLNVEEVTIGLRMNRNMGAAISP